MAAPNPSPLLTLSHSGLLSIPRNSHASSLRPRPSSNRSSTSTGMRPTPGRSGLSTSVPATDLPDHELEAQLPWFSHSYPSVMLLDTYEPPAKEKQKTCCVGQFLWHKCSHQGQCQTNIVRSLTVEMEREAITRCHSVSMGTTEANSPESIGNSKIIKK